MLTTAAWSPTRIEADRSDGDLESNVSPNIVDAVVIGVLGRNGRYTATMATACVIVPTVNPAMVTPHTESFQALIWYLLFSDPCLQMISNKWESSNN